MARPLVFAIASTTASAPFRSVAKFTTIAAPADANPLAIPAPMPFDAPVTSATLPSSFDMVSTSIPATKSLTQFRRHGGRPTVTLRQVIFSVEVQRRADVRPVQNSPEPLDLVRGLEERVIAIDGCVLTINDV